MPVRLFFAMETQLPRIRAEQDLRRMAVVASVNSKESIQKVHQALVIEQGDVYQLEHNALVAAEPGAVKKLKSLFGA